MTKQKRRLPTPEQIAFENKWMADKKFKRTHNKPIVKNSFAKFSVRNAQLRDKYPDSECAKGEFWVVNGGS